MDSSEAIASCAKATTCARCCASAAARDPAVASLADASASESEATWDCSACCVAEASPRVASNSRVRPSTWERCSCNAAADACSAEPSRAVRAEICDRSSASMD